MPLWFLDSDFYDFAGHGFTRPIESNDIAGTICDFNSGLLLGCNEYPKFPKSCLAEKKELRKKKTTFFCVNFQVG